MKYSRNHLFPKFTLNPGSGLALLALLLLNFQPGSARAATLVWTNTAGGNWTNAANWSPNQVPTGADAAFITNAGAYTVSVNANAQTAALTLGGSGGTPVIQQTAGTFTLGSPSRVLAGGGFTWSVGTLSGALTVETNGSFTVSGASDKNLNAAVTNRGTMQLSGNGVLNVHNNNGARLENQGVFDIQGDQDIYGYGGTPMVRNTGLLRKTAGSGNARIGVSGSWPINFQNSGTVEAQSGVLQFFGGGLLDGTFHTTAAGARNEFVGGTFTHSGSGTPVVSGSGSTRLTGGTMQLHNASPNFQFIGGTVVLLPGFQGAGAITNLTMEGSTLNGTNLVTGTLRWRNGTFNGALTVASNALFVIEGTSDKNLNAAVTNRGTMQLSGSGNFHIYANNGARLENLGTFDLLGDQDLYGQGGTPVLRNLGLLRKTAGTGNARVGISGSWPISLQNSGTVEAQSGVLQFFGGGLLDGVFTTASGARNEFVGGTFTHSGSGTPVVSGSGSTRLTGGTMQLHNTATNFQFIGGTVVLLPDFQSAGSITNLTLDGSTLNGTNLVTGTLRWRAGTFNGALTVATNGLFIIEGTSDKNLNAAVTNQGTLQLSGSGNFHVYASNGARLENLGTFDLLGDQDIYGQGGTPILRNLGLLRKTAGTGNARVGISGSWPINLQNSGTVQSQSGTIQFYGGGLLDGTFTTTTAAARIEFTGGTFTHSGSGAPVVTGTGLTRFTGGTFQLHDTIPNLQFVGGTVVLLSDFQGTGTITNLTLEGATLNGTNLVTGVLRWRNGTLNGALTVSTNGLFIIEGTADKNLNAVVTNRGAMQLSGSGNFHIYANNGARLENFGTFDLLGDQDIYGQGGTPILRNLGLLRKTAGTGNARVGISGSWPINLQNTGTVEAQSGVIQCFGGGLLDGTFNTTVASARNEFVGGTFSHSGSGTPVVSGSGSTRLTGGTMQLHNASPNFQFIGGTVVLLPDFQGTGAITNLTLDGSTLNGTNLVTGTLRWRNGTFNGALTVATNGLFIIEGSAEKSLNAAVTNRGTIQLSGGGNFHIYANNGARLENLGTFDLQGDQDLYGQGGTPVLRNAGLLRKTVGSGNARVGISGSWPISLQNSGTVEAQTGVIQFFGGGLVDGVFTAASGARNDFTGGTFTHSGSGMPLVTGTGLTRFTGGIFQLHDNIANLQFVGGTVVLLSDFQGTGAITNLTLEGSTLNGTNLVTGTLRWRNGTFNGALTVASNGLFIIEGTADKILNAAVTNRGTMQLSGSGNFQVHASNGARIENLGTFDLQGDQDLYGYGGSPVLRNLGLLRKTTGTGNARVGISGSWPISLQNSGAVEAQSGTLLFFGTYSLAGGVLRSGINSLSTYGRISFSGNVSLAGTLSAYLVGGYSPAVSNKFNLVSYGSFSGAFTGSNLPEGIAWRTDYAATVASITALGSCTPPPAGLLAWWPGDGNANDVIGSSHGTLQNGAAANQAGLIGQAFSLDGVNDYVDIGPLSVLQNASAFSVMGWFRKTDEANTVSGYVGKWNTSPGSDNSFLLYNGEGGSAHHPNFVMQFDNLTYGSVASGYRAPTNVWFHLAVTWRNSDGSMRFYTNGQLAATSTAGAGRMLNYSAGFTAKIGEWGVLRTEAYKFKGLIDDVVIAASAFTSNEIAAVYAAGAAGLCRATEPPFVLAHPQSRTNGPNSTATFSVVAAGSIPIFYQWRQGSTPLSNGGRISGAQSNALTITGVQVGDAGAYSCIVSNLAGSTNSIAAQLVVDATPPVISLLTTNPATASCTISWQTDEPATAEVHYGATTSYGFTNRSNGALRTQHTILLTGLTPGALYHFRVRSADVVSNATFSADLTFTTQTAPDLQVAAVSVPSPAQVQSGAEITIRWVLTNSGLAEVNWNFYDRVMLVNSNTSETLLNNSYYYNPAGPGGTNIPPGGTLSREVKYRLPDGPRGAGPLGIIVNTDHVNSIIEHNGSGTGEANNTGFATLASALPNYPDLQIANLQLLPPSPLSGTPLQVLWQSTNSGSGTATGQWWDRVLIVNTTRNVTLFNGTVAFDTAALGPLTNGTSRSRSLSFTLPDSTNAVGNLAVTVTADLYSSVFEYMPGRDAETNNNATANTTVTLATYPDLRVVGLQVTPASPVSGDLLTVNWIVTNAGNAAVNGSFNDRALLRRAGQGSSLASQNLFYDATQPANGSIAPGETRARQVTLLLPDGTNGVGNMQIELTTDVNNQVLEIVSGGNAEANNIVTNSFTSTLAAYSDLVAGGIVNPASGLPGATITLRWNVTNIGVGPLTDSWSEQVFWSDDAALGNDDLLATFAYTNTLAPGASISRTQQVVVPTLESGNRWFIIRVDSADRIFELNESNNVTLGVSPLNVPVSTTLSLGGSTIGEGAVRNATLSRNGNTGSSATFTLTSFLTNRLVVPASVNIPAGQASTGFQIAALENALVDGNPLVGVTAAAAGYAPASNNVTVVDNDQPTLFLQISKTTLTEGAGTNAAIVYLTRNTPTNSPLVVPLAVSDSARVFVPDQVTINAGASSVAFDVSIGDNLAANLTAQASVSASVPGYQTFPAQFTLLDNDTPSLALSLSAPVLIENAPNPAGTLTITRSPVTANRARLALTSVNGTVATVPSIAIIETNQASVNVPITVFNNAIADGPRVVELRVYPTDDLLSTPLIASGQTIQFTVSDDDGPALAVQIAAGVISETGATTGTVRRNTTTSSNLVVNLASSLPGEATVPATVTISNGQTSATFPITGVADGQPDGNRSVSITANAVGFNPGGAALNVSDIDLPDLRPMAILATNAALTDSLVPLSFVVQNTGLALAEGSWVDRVYLANSPAGDGLQFVGQSTRFADVPLGGSYTSTAVAFMPGQAGTYNVLVVVDENTQLNDGNRANNRLFSTNTITVNPAYRATIVADLTSTVAGTPIPLHGRAFRPSDNSSVPFARVIVRTHVKGVRRTFETFSDASGNINYVLRLLPSEAGLVLLSADHPGVKEDVTQDTVEVYGMRFAEYEVNPRIFPYLTHTGAVDVVNLGDLPLTGLSAVFEGLPEFVIPEITVSNALPASERIQLTYRLTATNVVSATLVARIKLTSAEGAVATVQTRINLQPLTTTLVSTPGLVQAGAVRGEQKPVEFMVANVGGIASGELTVIPPALPWVTLSSPSNLPSLGPGESTRVTLLLTPAADAALTLFNAPLYIVGENARLEVPTRLRIMSSAIGDLRVEVQDDYTYYVEGAPRVTNATVRLTDPYTHEVIAEGLTYPSGSIVFSNLLEGPYQMRVTADKHSTFAGPAIIAAGQESSRVVFLTRQTVSYRWTVVPTEVEDRYQVVLEPVFEVDVPIPVVTLDTPRLPMIVRAGGEGHFDIRLSNHGLIAAERVTVTVPDDPDYELTPLTDVIDVLPAKSTITIPIRVRAKATAPRIAFSGPNGGGIVSAAGLPTCGKTITGCDSIPKMSVKWSWVCGQNRQWMGAQADLEFSCAPDDCWEKIKDRLEDLGENVLKGDVADLKDLKDYGKDAICELLAELAACLGITDQCALAAMQAACGIATRDIGTAISGAAGLGANCICPNFDLPSYKPSAQSDFGAFDGEAYYSGPATFGKPAEQPVVIVESGGDCEPGLHPARPAKRGDVKAAAESVCARVRLRLEQEVALTRQAFLGALEIDNGNLTPLTDIQVILDIRDTAGSNVNHRFAVGGPELDGLSAVDGSGVISPQSPGSARYTFIPTREAAPDGPAIYKFGGTLIYYTEGVRVELPLTPEPITVYPDPALHLDYFLQRDVYGDDPFTDEVEPSEPFALGLLVRNLGKGPARNMRITSAQPKIIENEKGLLIDFKLIGTMAGTNPITPSLTVKLGDINAGSAQVAGFFMTASLQGKFIEYNASFEHLDTLGDQRTSLIDSLTLHEMTRVVRDDRAGADAAMDFLANDVPDGDNFPDTIWFSNGAQSPVNPGVNPSIIGTVDASNLQVQLTATMQLGWAYLKIPDPGRFFRLHRVVRSDGKEILVGTNVWTTDRSFPSTQAGAIRENLLHLLDHNSTGSYTLYYRIFDGIAPQIVSVGAGVANIQTTAVTNIDVVTSESIEFSSFNTNDLVLTRNGINLSTASLTITNIGTNVYRIGGLAPLTGMDGNYQLTVIGSGLNDFGGNPVSNNGVLAWAKGVGAPVVAFITAPAPDPRNIAVSNLDITFTQPIDPVTFTLDDLQLTRDGGANVLDSTPTLTPLNATTFRLAGLQALTLADGVYALTAFGTGVSGTNGATGIGSLSRPWTMLTTGPTITELEAVNPNPRNIVVQALELTFARAIDPTSFDWRDLTLTRDGGANLISSDVQVTQLSNTVYRLSNFNWVQSTAGNYTLTVFGSGILDPAGNTGSGAESQTWSLVLGHPPEPKQLAISPDTGVSASDGVTSSNAVTLTGKLSISNLTVRVYDDTVGADLGTATVVGTNFSKLLTFDSAGLHELRIYSVDGAQNVSSNVLFNVFLDVSSPGGSFVAVDPNHRTNAVPSVDVQFTEAVNSNSITRSAFALRRNGGADLLTPAVTVTRLNPSLFRLGNLTALNGTPGDYALTLNLSPIEDLAGNRGGGMITQAWTVVVSGPNSAPVLQAITNRTVAEGVLSRFTAIASDPDQPAQTLTFSLGTGAPSGAGIDAVSGAFTWRPNSLQGPAVYPISVIVRDTGQPSLSATQTFLVTVTDALPDVVVSVDSATVLTGQTSSVPIRLDSGVVITNLTFDLQTVPSRLGQLALQSPSVDVLGSTWQPLGGDRYRANLVLNPIPGGATNRTLVRLGFVADANPQSAFVDVKASNVIALRNNGTSVANTAGRTGRISLVGIQPLLQISGIVNRSVLLHGRIGVNYVIEGTDELGPDAEWLPVTSVVLSNVVQLVALPPGPARVFYRALEAVETGAALPLSAGGGQVQLRLTGIPGQIYQLERRADVNSPWLFQRPILLSANIQTNQVPGLTTNELWRLRLWYSFPPQLSVSTGSNGTLPVTIFGRPGITYRLEHSGNLGSNNWQVISNAPFMTPGRVLTLPAPGSAGFYRALEP